MNIIGMNFEKAAQLVSNCGYYPVCIKQNEKFDDRELDEGYHYIIIRYNPKNKVISTSEKC